MLKLILLIILIFLIINLILIDPIDKYIFTHLIFYDQKAFQTIFSKYLPHFLSRLAIIIFYALYIPTTFLYNIYEIGKYDTYFLSRLWLKLKHPFILPAFEGAPYSFITFTDNEASKILDNKLFWYKFFTKYGVKTPQIHGIIKDGNLIGSLDKSKTYIIKPDDGFGGQGVGTYTHGKTQIPKTGVYLIQEKIQTCNTNQPQSMRIITLSKHGTIKLFLVRYMKQPDPTKVTTNGCTSSTHKRVDGGYFVSVEDGSKEKIPNDLLHRINNAVGLAKDLHSKIPNIPTLGWDVILSCDGPYFLEGNLDSTLVWSTDRSFYQLLPRYIQWMKS